MATPTSGFTPEQIAAMRASRSWSEMPFQVLYDDNGNKYLRAQSAGFGNMLINAATGERVPEPPMVGGQWMPSSAEGGGPMEYQGGTPDYSNYPNLQPWTGETVMGWAHDPDPGKTFLEKIWPYATAALGGGAIAGGLGLTGGAGAGGWATGAGEALGGGLGSAFGLTEGAAGLSAEALAGGAAADTLSGAVPAWAPLTQTGTTFATGAELGPSLLEAAQLASQGLTAAEMVSLGIAPQIAQAAAAGLAGPLSNALQGAAVPQVGGNTNFLGDILKNVFGSGTGGSGINWWDIAKTALQVGTSLYSGNKQADAAAEAALQQRLGAQAAIDEQRRQFDVTRGDLQPWLRGGRQGLVEVMQMLGIPFNPVTGQPMELRSPEAILRRDPEYQFQLSEGLRALERSAAATTGTLNPRATKALQRYGQGLASNAYTNRYNRLAALSGLGQVTGQNLGTFGQANATNIGDLLTQQGNALSAGTIGAANARASGLEGAAGAIGQFGQNQQLDQILRKLAYSNVPQLGGLS